LEKLSGWLPTLGNETFTGSDLNIRKRSAICTILQSCKTYGIDTYAYLKDVLERLPHMTNQQIHLLTPRAWAGEKSRSMKLAS